MIDLRWLRWQEPFIYRDRAIRWARRHTDLGTLYRFEDPDLGGAQQAALNRKRAEERLSREEFEEKSNQAKIVTILSDPDREIPEIYDL